MAIPKVQELPSCFGGYESDHATCNGDEDSSEAEDRTPCPVRDHCSALLLHCEQEGRDPDEMVSRKGLKILDELEEVVTQHGIVGGTATVEDPNYEEEASEEDDDEEEVAESQESAGELEEEDGEVTPESSPFEPSSDLWQLYAWFLRRTLSALGKKIAEPGQAPVPGEVYDRDHAGASRYLGVYFKSSDGTDVPLARVRFRPRHKRIDVRIPVDSRTAIKAAGAKTAKRLLLRPCSSGRFKCESRNLDKEGAALMADLVGRLVKRGAIEL